MKLNILKLSHLARPRTYERAPAAVLTPEQQLRRSVLACMLWEDEFYESGATIVSRIRELVPQVAPATVAALAIEARSSMKLRHVPLLLVREMARHATHRSLVAETLAAVIQRADELSEFVAIYWASGKQPLSGQVKKGLAAAFPRLPSTIAPPSFASATSCSSPTPSRATPNRPPSGSASSTENSLPPTPGK
jgi:hypothetical protein